MTKLRPESEILKSWGKDKNKPLVSISCLTYNHEQYIGETIRGFLIQKTTFPFEILIHDDASTDKTADIIAQFVQKYPNIIKPIYQKENQWSHNKEGIKAAQYGRMKGIYVTLCEGDDYWIDPNKLQTQVVFLESHPEYSLSHTDVNFLYQHRGEIVEAYNSRYTQNDRLVGSRSALLEKLISNDVVVRTPTVVFRKKLWLEIQKKQSWLGVSPTLPMGDIPRWIELSQMGAFHYMNEVTAVYRVSENTQSRPADPQNRAYFAYKGAFARWHYTKIYEVSMSSIRKAKRNVTILALNMFVFEGTRNYSYIDGLAIGPFERLVYWLLNHKPTAKLVRGTFRKHWIMNL